MRNAPLLSAALFLVASLGGTATAQKAQLKIATLVPQGSVWDKSLRDLGEECQNSTDGRVRFKIYPGGVAGDEPDILRKMRIGQLHGGVFTMSGLGDIEPSVRVFEIPLFFRSDEEVAYVLEKMDAEFRRRLEAKGIVLLHWGNAGWLKFFSTEPARTVADLKRLKQFVWAGDQRLASWYQEGGFHPVPLAATDMLTGLKTGLIESLPSTSLTALSLQWFRTADYMLDYRVAPLLGGTVVTKKAWEELSPADREKVLAAAEHAQAFQMTEVPVQDARAVEEMKKRGLTVVEPDMSQGETPWLGIADFFANKMRTGLVPPEILDEVTRHLADFRSRADAAESGGTSG